MNWRVSDSPLRTASVATALAVCLSSCGCALLGDQQRVRTVHGPASFVIISPWGGTMTITLEQGGWVWFGPGGSEQPHQTEETPDG